ncbi:hypothetical protein N7492_007573 [Penicillium capsulatum]|uniref:Myb-like domain-containing protein n=1 Tax=Penicillium capsulatum TaxID=69766 RepID=A0A9W9LM71_9EURO|nr:hypothetical protein N7492_007573 [Penicillium capsulatum]KAJ6117407.1 hypothetical protein N7512_007132 [Penicillium capsulatum]
MDSSGALRPLDESLLRDLPQLSLRIAPLREPVSSRTLSAPSPLEPNASGTRDSNNISNPNAPGGNIPTNTKAGLPTVTEFLNAARTKKAEPADPQSNVELPPKPILPAFVNLRALERFPFSSSFDDDALHGPRKRRRLDHQADSFGEHLQLPIPQAQKEQRPPPFGPFAILNGLNEPPPNAALLPPIEAGSITQLLTKPSRAANAVVDPSSLVSVNGTIDGQPVERREARIEELLGATIDDSDDEVHDHDQSERPRKQSGEKTKDSTREQVETPDDTTPVDPDGDVPLSPKSRGRSRKNLRKWTEEETDALLRGVVKCGIGNWTTILAQPEFHFNKRTASNLKDRFRVCCPWAYRASDPNEATKKLRDKLTNALAKSQGTGTENSIGNAYILPKSDSIKPESSSGTGSPASSAFAIPEAHVATKAKRRSRRPFTNSEDDALLKGYAVHGFQWTLIQQDKRLNLGHRKATDLRDRFRTKFPDAYRDGGSVSGSSGHSRKQGSSATPNSKSRGSLPNSEPTSTPPRSTNQRRTDAHSRHASNPGPVDPALLPPPQGFLDSTTNMSSGAGVLAFPLDENPSGASSPWDNTLAPMLWDELG